MAKKKKDSDPGKAIAEKNAAQLNAGMVRNAAGKWVDPATLSPKQQEEEATQSNTPPLTPAMRAAEASAQGSTSSEDAYEKLADQQAQDYLQMTKTLEPLTSGATLPAIESTASQNASQMLGASSTSPVSQWLNAQTSAAQAQNAPALAAESQLSSAQDSAANLMASGIKNMGSAESQMMQAAPYQQLLSSLAADVPYKLLSGYTMPQIQKTLQQSEQGLGLSTMGNPTAPSPQLPTLNPGIIPAAPTTGTAAPGVTG